MQLNVWRFRLQPRPFSLAFLNAVFSKDALVGFDCQPNGIGLKGLRDGHQLHGAFLTACVLYGRLTGDSPGGLAGVPYASAGEADRRYLADAAARAVAAEDKK